MKVSRFALYQRLLDEDYPFAVSLTHERRSDSQGKVYSVPPFLQESKKEQRSWTQLARAADLRSRSRDLCHDRDEAANLRFGRNPLITRF